MKTVRIFRHFACEGPGYLTDLLQQRKLQHELVTIDTGASVPSSLDNVSGLVFMGGPMSVNDPLTWIADEIRLIQQAIRNNIPVLGICLGSQLMAKAMGARVYGGPCMEIGWLPLHNTTNSSWTADLPKQFNVFHWHGETFDLPAGAELLLSSERVAHQAFALGPHLALQFHVEVTAPMVTEWLQINSADLQRRCVVNHDAAAITAATPHEIDTLHTVADKLLGRWLDQLNG